MTYSRLYVEEGFGFALGWNYWFALAVSVAVELAAAQLVMKYWFPGVSGMVWSAAFLLLMFGLNAFSVRGFGEAVLAALWARARSCCCQVTSLDCHWMWRPCWLIHSELSS